MVSLLLTSSFEYQFYGCGLRTSELCALRWGDIDMVVGTVRVRFAGGTRERQVPLPRNAITLLQAESCYRESHDPVFGGARSGQPISVRTVERIVRRAAARAGVTKKVCCRTLRRSYAVQCLSDGMNVVELRANLGHQHVESTLAYSRYLRPMTARSILVQSAFRPASVEASSFPPALGAIQSNAP